MHFDAHQKPHQALADAYKSYKKASFDQLHADARVVDFARGLGPDQASLFTKLSWCEAKDVVSALNRYHAADDAFEESQMPDIEAFACNAIPGLVVIPSLVPIKTQQLMLERLLHRDLSKSEHKTNVHFHHDLVYAAEPASFFSYDQDRDDVVISKDPTAHKNQSVGQFLNRRLRWMTLGGQYDWTAKVYPEEAPPRFPEDHKALLNALFPATQPEAAIVNLYTPGDVLSLHRDVAETCSNGLISLSIGCDALFMISVSQDVSHSNAEDYLVFRLRSGDVVYMSGASRFAYHGVPQVIRGTCPAELAEWPDLPQLDQSFDGSARFSAWSGWLSNKRINLNVRQMFA